MLLAIRPTWLEPHLYGLDKMYRLHKWLGITALVAAVIHWWWATGTKWMVGWGWLTRPVRTPPAGQDTGLMEQWLRGQRGAAESVGEWAFYALVALTALALIKRFLYHLFTKTHQWLSVIFVVPVYHSIVLMKIDYWSQPLGWVTGLLMLGGLWAAVIAWSGRIGGPSAHQRADRITHLLPGTAGSGNLAPDGAGLGGARRWTICSRHLRSARRSPPVHHRIDMEPAGQKDHFYHQGVGGPYRQAP